jgi:hypothetical protein
MLLDLYVEALLTDSILADQVWELWFSVNQTQKQTISNSLIFSAKKGVFLESLKPGPKP